MAQRKKSTPQPDPLSAVGDDAGESNDPFADLGAADIDSDPLADLGGEGASEDPLAGLDLGEEPPVVAQGVNSLKGGVTASSIRNSIGALADSDPLVLAGIQDIQTGMAQFQKLFKDFDKLQSCMVATNNFQHGIQKQLAELFERIDKTEAGQLAILGALQELREVVAAAPAAALAPKTAADGSVTVNRAAPEKADTVVLNALLGALRARRVKQPGFKLSLAANPAVVWDALSKLLANLGHTITPPQVEAMATAGGIVTGNEIKF